MGVEGSWTASRPGQAPDTITGTGGDALAAMVDPSYPTW